MWISHPDALCTRVVVRSTHWYEPASLRNRFNSPADPPDPAVGTRIVDSVSGAFTAAGAPSSRTTPGTPTRHVGILCPTMRARILAGDRVGTDSVRLMMRGYCLRRVGTLGTQMPLIRAETSADRS